MFLSRLPRILISNIHTNIFCRPKCLNTFPNGPIKDLRPLSSNLWKSPGNENQRHPSDIFVKRARPYDNDQILGYLHKHLRSSEPTLIPDAVRLPSVILDDHISRHLAQGLTLMAVKQGETASNEPKLLGVSVNSTQCPWDPDRLENLAKCLKCKKTGNLMNFIAHMMREPKMHTKYDMHTIWEVTFLCTHPSAAGLGLGQLLTERSLNLAKDLGYKWARMDCTSHYSAKIAEKLNMTKEWEIAYKDYLDDQGNKVFTPQEPHTHAKIYSIDLQKSSS